MKKRFFTQQSIALTLIGASLFVTSCNDKDNNDGGTPPVNTTEIFHVGFGSGSGGVGSSSQALIKPSADLKEGEFDFTKEGFNISTSRTDRVYASTDGKTVYSLQYTNGTIKKYETIESLTNPFYKQVEGANGERDLSVALGSKNFRWKKIDDNTALAYNIVVTHNKNSDETYKDTSTKIIIANIDLATFNFTTKEVNLPTETDTSLLNLHTWRVDSPVVLDGKVYIGVAKRGYDGAKNVNGQTYKTSTLVMDFPSFENPKFIYSGISQGEAYGYRTPAYFTYNSSVYHCGTNETKILKITNGAYDDTYNFDLATALGLTKVGASGMFHAGNGIAYIFYYDAEKGTSWGSANTYWGVARLDLNNKTAVKLDLPSNLWLAPNQNMKLGKDGKMYAAIAPVDSDGNIYIFDPQSTSTTGYTKGATLKIQGDTFYLGVF